MLVYFTRITISYPTYSTIILYFVVSYKNAGFSVKLVSLEELSHFDNSYYFYSKKSTNKGTVKAKICYYDPQSVRISQQSSQSDTTPRILTIIFRHTLNEF